MKISYILQLKDFFVLLVAGFILGIFYGVINISIHKRRPLAIQILSDLIFSLVSFSVFIILINRINLGQLRLYLICGYILGFITERIILGKLFAKCYKKLYTRIVKLTKKFADSKLGRIILK